MPDPHPMAFKSGTSLPKVYRVTDRFSEDVEVTLDYRASDDDFDPFADGASRIGSREFTARASSAPANSMRNVSPAFSFNALAQVRSTTAVLSATGSAARDHQVEDLQNRPPPVRRKRPKKRQQFTFAGVLNLLHPDMRFRTRISRCLHNPVSWFGSQGFRFLPVPAALPVLPSVNQAELPERTHVGRRRHHFAPLPSPDRIVRNPYFGCQTTDRMAVIPSIAPNFPAQRVSDPARHCLYSLRRSNPRTTTGINSQEGSFQSARFAHNERTASLAARNPSCVRFLYVTL